MSEAQIREAIVEVGRRLYARGLISGNEGNISVRDGEALLITPAGVCKGFLNPESIVRADLHGRNVAGGGRVSTETQMHTAIYARRPDVAAVVHAHPPVATAFAVAGIPLDRPLIAEAVVTLGNVPVVPYGTPSTQELAANVAGAICDAHALLLANHGALAVGDGIWRAWERMETLEQLARISLATRLLGQTNPLPEAAVERLAGLRAAAGYPPPVCGVCGRPATPEMRGAPAPGPAGAPVSDSVTLSRDELIRLVSEAVARFGARQT